MRSSLRGGRHAQDLSRRRLRWSCSPAPGPRTRNPRISRPASNPAEGREDRHHADRHRALFDQRRRRARAQGRLDGSRVQTLQGGADREEAEARAARVELAEKDADEADEVNTLHGAVARAIDMHHFGSLTLPTKEGKLDWSLAEAVQPIKKATGADYALFSLDARQLCERRAQGGDDRRMASYLGRAALGLGIQVGYASLVDLNTGPVVWFNRWARDTATCAKPSTPPRRSTRCSRAFPGAR